MNNNKTELFSIVPLQLTNVLSISLSSEDVDGIPSPKTVRGFLDIFEDCIAAHGAKAIGSLIMKTSNVMGSDGEMRFLVSYMRELDVFIHDVTEPFEVQETVSKPSCFYIKFKGMEEDFFPSIFMRRSQAKEKGLSLAKEIYILFVSEDVGDDSFEAEIYMPVEAEGR